MRSICALLSLFLLFSSSLLHAADSQWEQDFEKAKAQAVKEKKDLLIDFTGSDWCGWCKVLNKEVFSQEAFQDSAPKSFILVEIDFPQDKSNLTPAIIAQNERLSEEYAVSGFPTILLTDAKGVPYAQTGYRKGGPEEYVEHLAELTAVRDKRDAAFAAAESQEGVEKAKSLAEGLSAMSGDFVLQFYRDKVEQVLELDPDNESGQRDEFVAMIEKVKTREMREKYYTKMRDAEDDPEKLLSIIEEAVADKEMPTELRSMFQEHQIDILLSNSEFETALKTIDEIASNGTPEQKKKMQLRKGVALIRMEKIDDAIKVFDEAIKKAGDDNEHQLNLHFAKGQSLVEAERLEEAVETFDAALEFADDDVKGVIERFRKRIAKRIEKEAETEKE